MAWHYYYLTMGRPKGGRAGHIGTVVRVPRQGRGRCSLCQQDLLTGQTAVQIQARDGPAQACTGWNMSKDCTSMHGYCAKSKLRERRARADIPELSRNWKMRTDRQLTTLQAELLHAAAEEDTAGAAAGPTQQFAHVGNTEHIHRIVTWNANLQVVLTDVVQGMFDSQVTFLGIQEHGLSVNPDGSCPAAVAMERQFGVRIDVWGSVMWITAPEAAEYVQAGVNQDADGRGLMIVAKLPGCTKAVKLVNVYGKQGSCNAEELQMNRLTDELLRGAEPAREKELQRDINALIDSMKTGRKGEGASRTRLDKWFRKVCTATPAGGQEAEVLASSRRLAGHGGRL